MELLDWDDVLDDDSCLAREECVEELINEAAPGCFYCRLSELADGDED